ncbi:MAG: hypothetical protein JWQ34_1753 [Mucilaginibacter sp.]|uniref:hypothetical protein n=1 Tax=Mucilaginibacter sp. TaxID=1882438 RepID=UPI00261118BE|nr:hypothetical protein [Mucilaginibacter sp.]MDB5003528.1 hypothetical protein [Mucilaginibacter sp.]
MADNNKNNVSINVEINADGQQQINQYKGVFDSLKTSISNLSNPINKLDSDVAMLNDSLKQLSSQNEFAGNSIVKIKETYTSLTYVISGLKKGFELAKVGALSFEAVLTGGLSVVLAFLPEIINFTTALFKGKEATSVWAQNFKNLNEVMKAANKDAAEQTAKLDVLYKSATNANNAQADRLKYAQQLKDTYPEQFKNFDREQIANGKAKTAYTDLAKSILASAKAKAALNKMTEQTAKLLDADYQIEKIKNANYNEVKNKKEELAKQPTFYRGGRSNGQLDFFKKESDDRAKTAIDEQNKIKIAIQANVDYLMKFAKDADSIKNKVNSISADVNNNVNISYHGNGSGKHKKHTQPVVPEDDKREPDTVQFENTKSDTSSVKTSLDQSVQKSLEAQKSMVLTNVQQTQRAILDIETDAAKKKIEIEEKLTESKIHAGDKFIDAALKNSKKDSAIFKTAFLAKKATSIADTIISTKRAVMESLKAYAGIPFIGQALGIAQAVFMGAQGAASIAEISKQKPGFAKGGRFVSDGKGALLSGYSRTDNTNAYLRSGEAVVVSEAMRNPWARNLVSAINVAHGGRDFSITNPGRGYAIGGIFTDGGNSNRYYNQPMNDQKDLANTIAYQMINNFPPVYVDVKDINSQQNILAQTVNRVNL